MKKFFILFFIALLFVGCGTLKRTTYITISSSNLMTMFNEKKSFILFIGSNNCSHCTSYKKTLENVIKDYNVEVFYIDISKLSKEEELALTEKVNFTSTPTTVFIVDGKENNSNSVNRIIGSRDYSVVVEKFKKNGYIKE